WLYFAAFSAALVGWYKLAPSADEDSSIKHWLAQYRESRTLWEDVSIKHIIACLEQAKNTMVYREAKVEPVHRYRYPQRFEQYSPFLQPVGFDLDPGNVEVKA
ncbi:hypothetical protein OBBRIDRAFT_725465, partial [Obba rivulosa]